MCNPAQGFKLCTCTHEHVVHNKNSRRNRKKESDTPVFVWNLLRFSRKQPDGMIGLVRLPAKDIGSGLTNAAVVEQLNASNCFDFDYTPQEKDELRIKKQGEWESYLVFTFQNGEWVADTFSDPFIYVMDDIGQGKLKLLNNDADHLPGKSKSAG